MGMQLIETIEVGSGGAASIEFTSIPQDGVDLLLLVSARNSGATTTRTLQLKFNGSTSTSYDSLRLYGTGSAAASSTVSASDGQVFIGLGPGTNVTANTFNNKKVYLSNYMSSANKSASVDSVLENNATFGIQELLASSIQDTNPITSLELSFALDNFVQYSTASLYKITAD